MTTQAESTIAQTSTEQTSVIINVSTPGAPNPICRIGSSDEVLGDMTVRELVARIVSPKSLFSVGVSSSQLEAESPAAQAIEELLSADSAELVLRGSNDEVIRTLRPDEPARTVAQRHTGAQGTAFLDLNLEVRPAADNAPPETERRQLEIPDPVEAPPEEKAAPTPSMEEQVAEAAAPSPAVEADPTPGEETPEEPTAEPVEADSSPDAKEAKDEIVTIVAKNVAPSPTAGAPTWDRKEYVRKSDWLRAQFLPEVEALNFTGLFVGNLGLGIREEEQRRQVVLADPARITDILLRGNGYRRSGDHAKALICYQELVDMDPGNADFRFLLGKTLAELKQYDSAVEAYTRARELGHTGAAKELDALRKSQARARRPLGFLRFWKQ